MLVVLGATLLNRENTTSGITQDRMLKCYAASLGISRDFDSISLKWNQRFRIGKKLQESLKGAHSMTSCQCDKRESHIAVNYKRVPV